MIYFGRVFVIIFAINFIQSFFNFYLFIFLSFLGPFFTEGTHSKNTPGEVNYMMSQLEKWSNVSTRPSMEETLRETLRQAALKVPLTATTAPIDIQKFMGKWYVMANIPMPLEVGASNSVENYAWDEKRKAIDVLFEYIPKDGKTDAVKSKSEMHAKIVNSPVNSFWALNPKILGIYLPLGLSYLVLQVADDGSYALIGVPDRSYMWILTRLKPTIKDGGKISDNYLSPGGLSDISSSGESKSEPVCVAASREIFELSPSMEDTIMRNALKKAVELGYDTSKVLNIKWSV